MHQSASMHQVTPRIIIPQLGINYFVLNAQCWHSSFCSVPMMTTLLAQACCVTGISFAQKCVRMRHRSKSPAYTAVALQKVTLVLTITPIWGNPCGFSTRTRAHLTVVKEGGEWENTHRTRKSVATKCKTKCLVITGNQPYGHNQGLYQSRKFLKDASLPPLAQ